MNRSEQLTYINARGESIVFSPRSVFHVNDVSGLSDASNKLYTTNGYGQHGESFVGAKIESRSIDLSGHIIAQTDIDTAEKRQQLIHRLTPLEPAILIYDGNGIRRVIECCINSTPKFTHGILEKFSVTFECLNPFWSDETEAKTDIAAWTGALQFPLELTESGIVFGERQDMTAVNVINKGDVATGVRIVINSLGAVGNPVIMNSITGEFIRINRTLAAGEVVEVITEYNRKNVLITKNGNTQSGLPYSDIDSTFLQLAVGDNLLQYSADGAAENLNISIYHKNLYLGV